MALLGHPYQDNYIKLINWRGPTPIFRLLGKRNLRFMGL